MAPVLARCSDTRRAREQRASESMPASECRRRASVVGVGIAVDAGEVEDVDVDVWIISPAASSKSVFRGMVSKVPAQFWRNRTTSSSTSSSQRLSLSPSDARMRISFARTGRVMSWAVVRGVIGGGGGEGRGVE